MFISARLFSYRLAWFSVSFLQHCIPICCFLCHLIAEVIVLIHFHAKIGVYIHFDFFFFFCLVLAFFDKLIIIVLCSFDSKQLPEIKKKLFPKFADVRLRMSVNPCCSVKAEDWSEHMVMQDTLAVFTVCSAVRH